MKFGTIIKQIVSGENGQISSKRVMGIIMSFVCLGCIIYLVICEGGTLVVENLLQTTLIMAASLLGISSVTGIWRGNSIKVGDDKPQEPPKPVDPCQNCPHNKNK
jgi:hypothetical protein